MERQYWRDIATDAQLEAAYWSALARVWWPMPIWSHYQQKAEALYSRARWAMFSTDCP
jgi:hypothetical protein